MDIASLSTSMSQASLGIAVSIKLNQLVKEQAVQQGDTLVRLMEQSAQPHLGSQIDVRL